MTFTPRRDSCAMAGSSRTRPFRQPRPSNEGPLRHHIGHHSRAWSSATYPGLGLGLLSHSRRLVAMVRPTTGASTTMVGVRQAPMIRHVRRLWGAPRWPGGRKAEDGETNPKSTSYLAKNLLSLSFAKSWLNQLNLVDSFPWAQHPWHTWI
jgi:hypothetical protein